MNSYVISSFLAITAGLIALMYEGVAEKAGWTIGKLFTKYKGWSITIAILIVLSASYELIHIKKFLIAALYFAVAFFLAIVLTSILKHRIQTVAVILLILSTIIWIVGGINIVG
jgi:hypothetical protein